MAKQKTRPGSGSVPTLLSSIDGDTKRQDCKAIAAMMALATKVEPKLWASMVGYGERHFKYASGREVDTFIVGFAPRKSNIALYLTCDLDEHAALLAKLGKHRRGTGCLYINKLSDVDVGVLTEMIAASVAQAK